MNEPVSGMGAMRRPDDEVGGLPMPRPPAEAHLRNIRQTTPVAVWVATVCAIVVGWSLNPTPALIGVGLFAWFCALMGWITWRSRVFQKKNADAIALLNARNFDAAAAAFSDLAKRAPTKLAHGLAVYNVAAVAARKGDLERALSVLGAVWKAKVHTMMGAHQLREQVPLLISMTYTQLGDVDAGEKWLAAARKIGKHPALSHMKGDMLAEASLLARRGQYAAANALLAQHWRAIEETVPAALMRGTRLMRAFVVERSGGSADEVDQLCAGCRPFEKGEYDSLAIAWPEVQSFLAARGFV
jgi:hypothetical protein